MAWQKENFPGRGSTESSDTYAISWLGCARSWEAVMAAWDEGDFAVLWPAYRLPWMGLITVAECETGNALPRCCSPA